VIRLFSQLLVMPKVGKMQRSIGLPKLKTAPTLALLSVVFENSNLNHQK